MWVQFQAQARDCAGEGHCGQLSDTYKRYSLQDRSEGLLSILLP